MSMLWDSMGGRLNTFAARWQELLGWGGSAMSPASPISFGIIWRFTREMEYLQRRGVRGLMATHTITAQEEGITEKIFLRSRSQQI